MGELCDTEQLMARCQEYEWVKAEALSESVWPVGVSC